jgi:hypothetical protein
MPINDIHNKKHPANFKPPSTIHILKFVIKLLPLIISCRKDRRQCVKLERKNVDTKNIESTQKNCLKFSSHLDSLISKSGYFANAVFGSTCQTSG